MGDGYLWQGGAEQQGLLQVVPYESRWFHCTLAESVSGDAAPSCDLSVHESSDDHFQHTTSAHALVLGRGTPE